MARTGFETVRIGIESCSNQSPRAVGYGGSNETGSGDSLRLLSVAFPFAAVRENTAGGAEQVLRSLDHALVAQGHYSAAVVREGSEISGVPITIRGIGGKLEDEQEALWRECRNRIDRALADYPFDLIHFHGLDFFRYLPSSTIPMLVTLHLPPSWYPQEIFRQPPNKNLFLHCVSESQSRHCLPSDCLLSPIPNGVVVPAEPPQGVKSDFVLALGRICPEKGFHIALDAARQLKRTMILAGAVFPYEAHQRYFQDEIVPRLDQDRQFVGPVGGDEKRRLMATARCVVIPSLVSETSSLVAMEAAACGTPVIAFPNGALEEIIDHGRTGFLVKNENEMAEAIEAAASIPSRQCWELARARFSVEQMVERYIDRYRTLRSGAGSKVRYEAATG